MKHQHAFTLVELSIVLVILGLLIGGVLTGQSLIRAAELRTVSTQFNQYLTATQTFRDKYFALPGDMTNAQTYWGIANATPATCVTTASTTAVTCNGDGNGRVDVSAGSNEQFRYWQHLANAGLIEGSYSGITQGSTTYSATKVNTPSGKISSSLWHISYWGTASGLGYAFNGDYGNAFQFGGITANLDPTNGILKPEEAYNIDMKMDDGKPGTGRIVMRSWGGMSACVDTTDNTAISANYLLSGNALGCLLVFRQLF